MHAKVSTPATDMSNITNTDASAKSTIIYRPVSIYSPMREILGELKNSMIFFICAYLFIL